MGNQTKETNIKTKKGSQTKNKGSETEMKEFTQSQVEEAFPEADVDIRVKPVVAMATYKRTGLVANVAIIIVAVLLLLLLISSLDQFSKSHRSPLYTSFTDNEVYVKRGFDETILQQRDVHALFDQEKMGWETIVPGDYSGRYIISSLLEPKEGDGRSFLSLTYPPVQEYTMMMPFEMSGEKIQLLQGASPMVAGVHLAGIGVNWEVFINGQKVASEIHLDGQGQIVSYRSLRSISFPLDADLLQEGTNTIIFRIIAPFRSMDSGLFYSAGYYISDYASILLKPENIITVISCTTYVFLGLYHFLMFLMRKATRYNLTFCMFAILVSVYFVSRTAIVNCFTMNSAVSQRVEYASFYALPLLLSIFVEQLVFNRVSLITKIYGILVGVLLLLQSISVPIMGDLLLVGQLLCAAMVFYLAVFVLLKTLLQRVRSQWLNRKDKVTMMAILEQNFGKTPLGNIFMSGLFLALTVIFDVVNALFFHANWFLTYYSFFLFTLSSAFILAQHFVNTFERVHAENVTLETMIKARTKALEEQVDIAEQASRAKGDFLANMSHEIRTPINAVIGMTTIGRQAETLEKKDYSFDRISTASNHLLGVINDILDMSKIEADKLELSPVCFNVRNVVQTICSVMYVKTNEKHQNFLVDIDENIPEQLWGDDQRLAQVVTNLLSNGVKFTPEEGDISLQVSLLETNEEGALLCFSVKDSGIGITAEQQSRLFTSFQQADSSTSRNYGGTGLGLALSKRIVVLMGGDISVASIPGAGSTFSFTVWLQKPTENEVVQEVEANLDEMQEGEFKEITVLLAEDIEINREIVSTLLEPSGITILEAENGREAVELFLAKEDVVDVIFMDVQMPVMDGYEATKMIRTSTAKKATSVPIIAMTANVFKADIDKCMESGMNAHVGKPISISDIVVMLRTHI